MNSGKQAFLANPGSLARHLYVLYTHPDLTHALAFLIAKQSLNSLVCSTVLPTKAVGLAVVGLFVVGILVGRPEDGLAVTGLLVGRSDNGRRVGN